MNYWRRYIGDYGRDTTRLTLAEHGAYGLLLDYYYAEEQPIPLDLDEVYRMLRAITPAERATVEKVLRLYFVAADDGYHNARAEHEIEVSRKARDNGARGGRPKTAEQTGRETGQVTGTETGLVTGDGGKSGHPPTTNHQPPSTTLQPPGARIPRTKARFALPEWVPSDSWRDYEEMRQRIRKPMTDAARQLAVTKLEELRVDGHSTKAVLDQSVLHSWQGLFELKGTNAQAPAAKGNGQQAPTKAVAYFEYADGQLREMADYPIGPHREVARTCARDYASRIARGSVRNVVIKVGPEQRRFTVQELTQ